MTAQSTRSIVGVVTASTVGLIYGVGVVTASGVSALLLYLDCRYCYSRLSDLLEHYLSVLLQQIKSVGLVLQGLS